MGKLQLKIKQTRIFERAKTDYKGNDKDRAKAVDAIYEELGTKDRTSAMKILDQASMMPHWPLYLVLGVTEVKIKEE